MSLISTDKIGTLVKTTLVDYPGEPAAGVFLKGCNLHCPYCYNEELSSGESLDPNGDFVTLGDLFSYLEKRQNLLRALVISGGEALLSPFIGDIIKKGKDLGYKIKIDTNGVLSERLEALLLDEGLSPDYVALDIKTSPDRYKELLDEKHLEYANRLKKNLLKSIALLSERPEKTYEFRTVLVPGLIDTAEIKEIGSLIPREAPWYLTQFINGKCLNKKFNTLLPYTKEKFKQLESVAKAVHEKTFTR